MAIPTRFWDGKKEGEVHGEVIRYKLDEYKQHFGIIWRDKGKEGNSENAYLAKFLKEDSSVALQFYNKLVGLEHQHLMGVTAMDFTGNQAIIVFLDGPTCGYTDLLPVEDRYILFSSDGGLTETGKSLVLSFVDLICYFKKKNQPFNNVGINETFFENGDIKKPRFLISPESTGSLSDGGVGSHICCFLRSVVDYHDAGINEQFTKFLASITKITPQSRKGEECLKCALMDHPFLANIQRLVDFFDDLYKHWYVERWTTYPSSQWLFKRSSLMNGWEKCLIGHYKVFYDERDADWLRKNPELIRSPTHCAYRSDICGLVKFIRDLFEHYNDYFIKTPKRIRDHAEKKRALARVVIKTEVDILEDIFSMLPDLPTTAYDFVHQVK